MTAGPRAGVGARSLRVLTWAAGLAVCAAVLAGCGPAGAGPVGDGAGPGSASRATAGATAPSTAASTPAPPPSGPEGFADELFRLTNEARAAEGLPTLAASDCAEQVALDRVTDLLGGEPLEHAPMDAVLDRCAPSTTAAENLVRADAAAAEVVDAWMGSPGHRANLLGESVSALGVACRRDGSPLLCAQIFLGP